MAAVRDPTHPFAQDLSQLITAEGSSIIVVEYGASVEQSVFDAVNKVTNKSIEHIDYVVTSADITQRCPFVKRCQGR